MGIFGSIAMSGEVFCCCNYTGLVMPTEERESENTGLHRVCHKSPGTDYVGTRVDKYINGRCKIHVDTDCCQLTAEKQTCHPGIVGKLAGSQSHVSCRNRTLTLDVSYPSALLIGCNQKGNTQP